MEARSLIRGRHFKKQRLIGQMWFRPPYLIFFEWQCCQIENRACVSQDGNVAQMKCDGIEEGSWNTAGVGWNTDGDGVVE